MALEYLHVVINHIPMIGLATVCVPLLYALVRGERHTLIVSLALCIVLGAGTAVVIWSGEEGHENIEHGPIVQMLDAPAHDWIHEHEERGEAAAIVAYITAAVAVLGCGLLWWKPKALRAIAAVMLVLCVVNVVLMARTTKAGGQIRHPEFRDSDHEHEGVHEG